MLRFPMFLSFSTLLVSGWAAYQFNFLQPLSGPGQEDAPVSASAEKAPPAGTMEVPQETVYRGDMINLRFSVPHGAHLAIRDPKGRFFYVVFPAAQATAGLKPLIDSETFVRRAELSFRADQLTGDPYTHGINKNQPVFTVSGTYTLIMGDNLAVDNPDELVVRPLKYRHESRPATAPSKKEGGDPAVAAAF
jgi:hypothetical protein